MHVGISALFSNKVLSTVARTDSTSMIFIHLQHALVSIGLCHRKHTHRPLPISANIHCVHTHGHAQHGLCCTGNTSCCQRPAGNCTVGHVWRSAATRQTWGSTYCKCRQHSNQVCRVLVRQTWCQSCHCYMFRQHADHALLDAWLCLSLATLFDLCAGATLMPGLCQVQRGGTCMFSPMQPLCPYLQMLSLPACW